MGDSAGIDPARRSLRSPRPAIRTTLLRSALLLGLWATATGAGINLAWDDCSGGAGASAVKAFACDTNAGASHAAYISLVAPDGIFHWESFEWDLVVRSDLPDLPAWWELLGAGQCRSGAVGASAARDYTGCVDLYLGNGSGGVTACTVGFGAPNVARLQGAFAVPSFGHADLDLDVEYFVAKIVISNPKTVGAGACAGCGAAACLEATRVGWLALGQVSSITEPAVRSYVRWQGDDAGVCPGGTPAARTTWGAVKALYR